MNLRILFRDRSIRARLSWLMAINSSVALLLLGAFLLSYEGYLQKQTASRELLVQTGIVAESSTAALSFADERAATETLTALRGDPTLAGAAIYDRDGRLFAWSNPQVKGRSTALPGHPEMPRPDGVYADGDNLLAIRSVRLGGERLGAVFLHKSLIDSRSRMKHYAGTVLIALVCALLLALLMGAVMQRSITRPISSLASVARDVSEKRDYSVRATRESNDEIGFLIDSFNEMLAQIETRSHALHESEERYALASQGANDGLWDWKLATNQIYFSPRWSQMLGYPDAEKWSSPEEWFSRIHPSDRDRVTEEFAAHREGSTKELVSEYRMRRSNGTFVWMLSRGLCVRDDGGSAIRMAGSQTDITQGKVADPLTGLPNRLFFLDRLESSIEASNSSGTQFAVLFLDLDRFKLVNDSLGHAAGDELLVEIARRLRLSTHGDSHGSTVAARLGGDEFAVLLNPVHDSSDIGSLAKRILEQLSAPFLLEGRQMFPGVSIGVAMNTTGATPEDLLRDADTAMYYAKTGGKGRYEVFDAGMRDRAIERLQLEAELRTAIEENQLVLYYQPKVLVDDSSIVGCEALVRWQHPKRGLLPPGDFIPAAEETDLILPLGLWVMTEACRQMAEWRRTGNHRNLTVAVNVSFRQLASEHFVDDVARVLAQTRLPARYLRLEMTESTIMANTEEAIATLRRLKQLGVGLEIDDFGTGYSSLSCLNRLPFDTVKIDRSFVKNLGRDEESGEIIRTILELARSMGMNVVAEGVESGSQMAALNSLGCEFAQGFLFSKPVTAHAISLLFSDAAMKNSFARLSGETTTVAGFKAPTTEAMVTNEV